MDVIDHTLERIEHLLGRLTSQGWQISTPIELGWQITPPSDLLPLPRNKTYGLAILGTVHGNELAGLGVIASFLRDLDEGLLLPRFPMFVAVGNIAAARERLRYLDRDLNRSFARSGRETREDARARELEPFLAGAAWLVDVHQTSSPSDHPFFIFPHTNDGVAFARAIAPEWPIITHWDDHYSRKGRCSDEYVTSTGGIGITVELGEAGMDPYQVAVGAWAVGRATLAVQRQLDGQGWVDRPTAHPLHTFAATVPFPEHKFHILAHVRNFTPVVQGQVIGYVRGEPLLAPVTGKVIFPVRPVDLLHLSDRPAVLLRILREVGDDLT